MNLQILTQPIDIPHKESVQADFKILGKIRDLFTVTTRRDAEVNNKEETPDKCLLMTLTSILLNCGLDAAKGFNDSISEIIVTVLKFIANSPNIPESLSKVIDIFEDSRHEKTLSVHRTTVDKAIPTLTKADMEQILEEDYKESMQDASTNHAQSKGVIIALDDTYEKSRPEHLNGNFSYVMEGQQKQWKRGLKFEMHYDCTHQRIIGGIHRDNYVHTDQKGDLPLWIQDLITKVGVIHDAGSFVQDIEGDRGFFNPIFFVCAYLGMFNPINSAYKGPRVITPWYFRREKQSYKWTFLLDPNRPQVYIDYLELDPKKHPEMISLCEGIFKKTKKGYYLIPCARVVLIDEYAKKSPRTLKDIRNKAIKIQSEISSISSLLKAAQAAYFANQKLCKTKHIGIPGKARKRNVFEDDKDRQTYKQAVDLYKALEKLKKKKTNLLRAVSFFAVSLRPDEDPSEKPNFFIQRARDYHERWGVENAIRDVKQCFLRPSRTQKPTRRQFYLMVGILLYNDWHDLRQQEILEHFRKTAWNKVLWDPRRVWVRRKLESKMSEITSAKSYMIRLWKQCLINVLKKSLKACA